jgi:hypothetical protein
MDVEVTDTLVERNEAEGVYLYHSWNASLSGLEVRDNGRYGIIGYFYVGSLADIEVSGHSSAPAVYLIPWSGDIDLSRVRIIDNPSTTNSFFAQGSSSCTIVTRNLEVTGNGCTGSCVYLKGVQDAANLLVAGNAGTGLYLEPGSTSYGVDLINATVVGNGGRGVAFTPAWYGTVELRNSVVAYNGGVGVQDLGTSGYSSVLEHNDVYGNSGGGYVGITDPTGSDGNIAIDPLFVAYSASSAVSSWDLHPAAGSPLIDAGDPSDEPDSDGSTADIGAYGGAASDLD